MVIKIEAIDRAHAANAIQYVLDKEKARKENKPVFLAANNIELNPLTGKPYSPVEVLMDMQLFNIELNPLTGKPYSPVEVLMDMQLLQAASRHKNNKPFWRIELCPPKEVCQDWTMEQWDEFCRDCVAVLDTTDYKRDVVTGKDGKPVIDKRTGKPKIKVSGEHTMLAKSQYVATVHFDTGKPHVHIVANRLTMDGQMQDTHKSDMRAIRAANIIADKYGWTRAEERDNQRMERIHDTAMSVLRRMDAWDIETYFAKMRRNGFEVEPTYDSHGICRGYSIGEKLYDLDGNYSSTVMYKASAKKFGHGRDLTVSKLYGTWQKLHQEKENEEKRNDDRRIEQVSEHSKTVVAKDTKSASQTNDHEYSVTSTSKEDYSAETRGKRERDNAIWLAFRAIQHLVESPFRTEFYLHDLEDVLPEGIVAKAIESEQEQGESFSEDYLKSAAKELMDMVECGAERANVAVEGLADVLLDIALPEVQPSLGGGGSSNNDLPKKKDDEWDWWKKNGFIRPRHNRRIKR